MQYTVKEINTASDPIEYDPRWCIVEKDKIIAQFPFSKEGKKNAQILVKSLNNKGN